ARLAWSRELVDGRADISGRARITYWLLTGQRPHAGRTPRELFQPLLTQPPVPLSQAAPDRRFPPALEAAVMRGLERDPARRQPTVAAFADEVTAGIAGGAPGSAPKVGLLDALKRAVRRDKR